MLSDDLRKEAQQEDNDLAYLGKMKKVYRQERLERFEDVLPKLNDSNKVTTITHYESQGKLFGIVSI